MPATVPDTATATRAADPRLARLLQQRQPQLGHRDASVAVVLRRRRACSPDAADARELPQAEAAVAGVPVAADNEEEEDEEAIARRRLAIRARQLATAAAIGADSAEEEGSEDSSEYMTGDDSEDERGPVMLKPAFVPKTERETLAEREVLLAQSEQTTRQQAEQLEDRKRQTHALVTQQQAQDAPQDAPTQYASDLNTDDDQEDEVAQYEAWRERELQRIARDRNLRQAGAKAEAALAAPSSVPAAAVPPPKKKWKFLQKYWHKGAFFQGEDEAGDSILGDILRRDYDAPTGEDKFDKQMLPQIMQVRNFGRRGRTKWQHLLAEDTMQAAPAAEAIRQPRQQRQDFDKPRQLPT